jgi:hypothetical protein
MRRKTPLKTRSEIFAGAYEDRKIHPQNSFRLLTRSSDDVIASLGGKLRWMR